MAFERCHDTEELQRLLGGAGSLGGPQATAMDGGQDAGGVAFGGGMVMGGM